MNDLADTERMIEALLFAAAEPLSAADLARRLPAGADVGAALMLLKARYLGRGVMLACVADRWRFQTAEDLAFLSATMPGYCSLGASRLYFLSSSLFDLPHFESRNQELPLRSLLGQMAKRRSPV